MVVTPEFRQDYPLVAFPDGQPETTLSQKFLFLICAARNAATRGALGR
jgi:hypothetical protein